MVAIKKIKLDENDEGIPSTTIREVAILKKINHRNVVKYVLQTSLQDVVILNNPTRIYLIFEYLDYDLRKFMESAKKLTPYQ